MKNTLMGVLTFFTSVSLQAQNLTLWYDKPAKDWMNQALPVGNGYMGAMVFGGVFSDTIQISEKTIWAGGPNSSDKYCFGNRKESWRQLPAIRELLQLGKSDEAAALAQQYFTGLVHDAGINGDFGAQQPWGDIIVEPQLPDTFYSDYSRSLDIENAVAYSEFECGGLSFSNECFASYPENLVVNKYQNCCDRGIDYVVKFHTLHKNFRDRLVGDIIKVSGSLLSNGMIVEGDIRIITDGKLKANRKGGYLIENARYVELYTSVATDYKNEYPSYVEPDKTKLRRCIDKSLAAAEEKGFFKIKEEHINDYRELFDRVNLDLGSNEQIKYPTDERIYRYSLGASDPALESLYFQYGRYLLISSSRQGTLPAHLQGVWNNSLTPPWTCDYHMNINLQMIYWPSEVANLSECHTPLLEYIGTLRKPGSVTAREYFNARGWVVNTINNPFGYTAPGWDFNWGYAPNSSAWLCDHLYKHYRYSGDRDFARNQAYPLMKEVGQFWLDYLSEDRDGTLVSSPSYSPEHGKVEIASTIDQEIAYDLFSNIMELGEWIDDAAFVDSIAKARARLSPLKIGRYGQLQEWKADLDDPLDEHRHVSHLYALYPGRQISSRLTPQLADAARRTLVYRGDEGTGWSLAWKINFWARLLDGNRSYKLLRTLLTPAVGRGQRPSRAGSYENLLCAHPPYQIDGNMGAVAGMCEMLLQSQDGFLDILPSLPSAWSDGKVSGLRAQGNYTVDITWRNGLLEKISVEAFEPGECEIRYKGNIQKVRFEAPSKRELTIDKFLKL